MANQTENKLKKEFPFINNSIDEKQLAYSKKNTWNQINNAKKAIRRKIIIKQLGIAASIAILIATIGYMALMPAKTSVLKWAQLEVPMGTIDTVFFTDGSTIVLNGGSKLIYPEEFAKDQRVVKLQGEGYFDIATNPNRPFIINCEGVDIQVLGTKFNLKSHTIDNYVEAKLASGHIRMLDKQTDRIVDMQPNESVTYNRETKIFKKGTFDPADLLGWINKEYKFKSTPLLEVVKTLERRYGVYFIIENEIIGERKITASFKQEESIDDIMKILRRTSHFKYEIADNIVTIK